MWGEIGPKRKALLSQRKTISAEVERTLIIKTSDGFILTFPSLFGTGRCLAKCANKESSWQVCVNPMLQTFEVRAGMEMVKGALVAYVPGNGCRLDFGVHNYELEEQSQFKKSGKHDTHLQMQKIHSDHRREVEHGRFVDCYHLNQEHHRWSTVEEWEEAGRHMEAVHPPVQTELGPISFLGAFLPNTRILITPKGQQSRGSVPTAIGLGRFAAFSGQVLTLCNCHVQCDAFLKGTPRRRRKQKISKEASRLRTCCRSPLFANLHGRKPVGTLRCNGTNW
jgi:hypothetical protein